MSDIVERLRNGVYINDKNVSIDLILGVMNDAADEIERLREQLWLAQRSCSESADEIKWLRTEKERIQRCLQDSDSTTPSH